MPRKLSPEHSLELDHLYRIVAAIGTWYDELVGPGAPHFSATLRKGYEARDLRGLRMAFNDLVEMTRAANAAQRRDLDARLRTQAQTSLAELDQKTRARVARIRVRGKVTSEEQYYLVREHVEFIATMLGQAQEAHELLGLLEAYEQRAIRRPGNSPPT